MPIEIAITELDELLEPWRPVLGADRDGYRNHCTRMLNFCFALHPPADDEREKCVIAACFHDLGLWTRNTLDYLPPSVQLAHDWLRAHNRNDWCEEIGLMIDEHHRLRPVRHATYPLIEAFRRADLVDFSLGLAGAGLERTFVAAVRAQIPNAGFHRRLVQLTLRQLRRDPLHPLPMMKW